MFVAPRLVRIELRPVSDHLFFSDPLKFFAYCSGTPYASASRNISTNDPPPELSNVVLEREPNGNSVLSTAMCSMHPGWKGVINFMMHLLPKFRSPTVKCPTRHMPRRTCLSFNFGCTQMSPCRIAPIFPEGHQSGRYNIQATDSASCDFFVRRLLIPLPPRLIFWLLILSFVQSTDFAATEKRSAVIVTALLPLLSLLAPLLSHKIAPHCWMHLILVDWETRTYCSCCWTWAVLRYDSVRKKCHSHRDVVKTLRWGLK